MKLTEEAMIYLEEQIPGLAERATNQAFLETLASGETVLIAENGKLIEIFPDGSRKVIKQITPPEIVSEMKYTITKK